MWGGGDWPHLEMQFGRSFAETGEAPTQRINYCLKTGCVRVELQTQLLGSRASRLHSKMSYAWQGREEERTCEVVMPIDTLNWRIQAEPQLLQISLAQQPSKDLTCVFLSQ